MARRKQTPDPAPAADAELVPKLRAAVRVVDAALNVLKRPRSAIRPAARKATRTQR